MNAELERQIAAWRARRRADMARRLAALGYGSTAGRPTVDDDFDPPDVLARDAARRGMLFRHAIGRIDGRR